MDAYEKIEREMAAKYGAPATTRKAIGDFMISSDHAVNVKSNNVAKQNYSPNMISIKKMHAWVFEDRKDLSFIFVDYEQEGADIKILNETGLIPIEHISWSCLSIEAQGYGVIQLVGGHSKLAIDPTQTKKEFYKGFLIGYKKYTIKESNKHAVFSRKFITDPDTICW